MKQKILSVLLLAMIAIPLISCQDNETSSSIPDPSTTTTTSEDKGGHGGLPTDIEYLDEPSIMIHYQRNDENYSDWALWLWADGLDGQEYAFNYSDDFGVIAYYALSTFGDSVPEGQLGFIIKSVGTWDAKDVDSDRFVDFSALEIDDNQIYHIYLLTGDAHIYTDSSLTFADELTSVRFNETATQISISANKQLSHIKVLKDGLTIQEQSAYSNNVIVYLLEDHTFDITALYQVEATFSETGMTLTKQVDAYSYYRGSAFEETYAVSEETKLGAYVDENTNKTHFAVWSPYAKEIKVNIYNNGTPTSVSQTLGDDTKYLSLDMEKASNGLFSVTVDERLYDKYYTYTVISGTYPEGKEIVDPYAYGAGVNGLRGLIVDFNKTNPTGWENVTPHNYDRKELVVYETHVSDITSSKTWQGSEANRYKFLGLIEENTTYTQDNTTVKTGFDHIKELGVNAVQLLPIFDQANDETSMTFNWGYNPLNYNVLEGSYSSNPYDGYTRIKEFKQVVQAFNEAGINIIMDVVYNHTSGLVGSNFDVLMPGYYYRYTNDGVASNGSGCGNETASEMPMYSRFMKDSTAFLASEYKLGGYRFDLMGLHDLDTMNELVGNLKTVNENIVVYGEPWTSGTTTLSSSKQSVQANGNKYEGFGQFNDQMRDALIKGGLSSDEQVGWVTSNSAGTASDVSKIIAGVKGITQAGVSITDPDKTVNYVTCHDNYTLYDRIHAAGVSENVDKMATLANAVVLTSQGTAFILAGEEILRSKQGDKNSYESGYEINELDYSRKITYQDVFNNYKDLINFKITKDALHLNEQEVSENVDVESINFDTAIKITINDVTNNQEIVIYHANGAVKDIPLNLDGYNIVIDTLNQTDHSKLNAYQTIITVK